MATPTPWTPTPQGAVPNVVPPIVAKQTETAGAKFAMPGNGGNDVRL